LVGGPAEAYASSATEFGTGGGSGEPSATITEVAFRVMALGTGGGSGEPSAINAGAPLVNARLGTGGGNGDPSATLLFGVELTNANDGATIRLATTRSAARYSFVWFKLEPPGPQLGEEQEIRFFAG